MTRSAIALTTLSLSVLSLPVEAATISISGGGKTYHVALHHEDARCFLLPEGEGPKNEARCITDEYFVRARLEQGCDHSFGPTYCSEIPPPEGPVVASQLECRYRTYVLAGGAERVRCFLDGTTAMLCGTTDGVNYAEANCAAGCRGAAGSGVCCVAGTENCPPAAAAAPASSEAVERGDGADGNGSDAAVDLAPQAGES